MLAFNSSSQISVKPVGPFDLGRMARLHRNCFDDAWSRADLAHLLALPGGFGLMARMFERGLGTLDGMRGVGFALCRVVRDECELLSIGVAPNFRRRAVGQALLRGSMERCMKAGAGRMFLEVAVDNHSAQSLYRAHGFDEIGRREDYYLRADGSRASAVTMRCQLSQRVVDGPKIGLIDDM